MIHISSTDLFIFPDHIPCSISDLMDYTDLGFEFREDIADSIGKAVQAVAVFRTSSVPRALRSVRTDIQKAADSFLPSHT